MHTAGNQRTSGALGLGLPVVSSHGLTSRMIMDFVSLAFSCPRFLAASMICITIRNLAKDASEWLDQGYAHLASFAIMQQLLMSSQW